MALAHDEAQQAAAVGSKEGLERWGRYRKPIVTEVVAASGFHVAEDYHQQYLEKRGQAGCNL